MNDHTHQQKIPQGQKCELCGMVAESAHTDSMGIKHYYCSHHAPASSHGHHGFGDHASGDSANKSHGSHASSGHDKHAGHSPNMFRDRFWLSLALTIPVVLYLHMIQDWLGFHMPAFPGSKYIPFILGTGIFAYGGVVFLKSAVSELKARRPGMMTLISLAILSAYAYSVATTFFIAGSDFFWELATLIVIMLLGHWIEMRSVANAQGALQELAKLLPDEAELESGKSVPVSELRVDDIVVVRPGAKIPADGTVVSGDSDVNGAMITGESRPVAKTSGDDVIAGTVNGTGSLKIKVAKVGESTALAGIMRLVAEAQQSRSRAQDLADRAAFYLTIAAIAASMATLAGWLIAGYSLSFTMERVVTVLVIACPHALGLAIPLVTSISTTLGARNGLLVKQRFALENARNITAVLFDKTGTLTTGEQAVSDIWPASGYSEEEVLRLAATVEQSSEHSIGKAIVLAAAQRAVALSHAEQFQSVTGQGVNARINEDPVAVGGPNLLEARGLKVPQELRSRIDQAGRDGKSVVYAIKQDAIAGALTITDGIREESKRAIRKLQSEGITVAMITGDSAAVARYVAGELDISDFYAEVLPEHKAGKVKELQKRGYVVAMVGDGVNDAPALVQADIGIAVGAGTDVAVESADIVLVRSNPLDIPKIITLSKATYRKMVQNLWWATGYNVVAIPLAAGVMAGVGIILPPAIGALLMSVSTVVVAFNAQLLRRLQLS